MPKLIRIQLDLPEEKVQELNEVMQHGGMTTRKDLFNNALTLLAWAIRERKKGRVIASVNEHEGSYKELIMPVLSVAPSAPTTDTVVPASLRPLVEARSLSGNN